MDTFIPPPEVAAEVAKGLELRRLHFYAVTPDVMGAAHKLAMRKPLELAAVQRIGAWFAKHTPPAAGDTRPSAARVQWLLHGGTAGAAWVKAVIAGKISGSRPDLPTIADALARRMTALEFPPDFAAFLGKMEASAQTNILLYGTRGDGKSSLALRMADMFSKFGNVLYIAAEEKLAAGTIKTRAQYLKVNSDTVFFLETVKYKEVLEYLDEHQNKFRFVVIDSKDMLDERDIITLEMLDRYPNLNFLAVAQVNKQRRSAGREAWPHKVDVVIRCYRDDEGARWAINEKNRLGATQETLFLFKPDRLDAADGDDEKSASPRSYQAWFAARMKRQLDGRSRLEVERVKHEMRMKETEHKLLLQKELRDSEEKPQQRAMAFVRFKKNGAEEKKYVPVENEDNEAVF